MDIEVPAFAELLRRVRAGEQDAAAELVRQYEPAIRRAVRLKLTDPRLCRTFSSMDICQSVLGNFFVRAAAGQFDLDNPEQLLKLLVRMAHNKVIDYARRERARRRDGGRVRDDGDQALESVPDRRETPSEVLAGRELLEQVRALLAEDERHLMEQRRQGHSWDELAAELGTPPDTLRMKLKRALDRVAGQIGLDEVRHE